MGYFRTPQAAGCAALFAVLTSATAMAIEEPPFEVLEQQGSFELREYPAYVVAETRVEAGFANAGNIAFQRLFKYISGNNVAQQEIAMTAPVTQSRSESRSEKIAMTAPVSQVADGDAYRVAFTLPATYTLKTAPKPLDPTVQIREVPAQVMACWRYTGRWTESNYRDNEKLLLEQIGKRGLVARGEPVLARYDPPFAPWFMRRNEVLIPVKPPPRR
jgi:hypothetical protein